MTKTYLCNLEVRGYELDSYGHVNHAVYVSYLEHARWKLLHEIGMTPTELDKLQTWPVIAQLEVSYRAPCFLGESLQIRTSLLERSKTGMTLQQEIYRGEQVVLQAKVRAVMVNQQGRPTAIPDAFVAAMELERL